MQNKYLKDLKTLAVLSLADSLLFYGVVLLIYDYIIKNKDGYGWAYILTLVFPFMGLVFAAVVIFKAKSYWKFFPLLGVIANLVILYAVFIGYALSEWQF